MEPEISGIYGKKVIAILTTMNDYRQILNSLPIGVIVTDRNGNIRDINRHAQSVMNLSDRPGDHQHISALLGDRDTSLLQGLFRADGFTVIQGFKIKKNDKILEMSATPVNSESGALTEIAFIVEDVTEMERQQEVKKQEGKNEAFGTLSAYIAHEIRNPLGSIALFASLLKKELSKMNDIRRVDQIIAAVKDVEDKISRMICSAETHQIPVRRVNIHEILRDILLFSEQFIDQEIVFLSTRYADIDPVIECNPDIMKQIFLNLIMNGLRAVPEGSRLDIITEYIPSTGMIDIYFVDTSPPASKNMHLNIYGNLSQTNPNYAGLGLAVVHNIVTMQKGSIRIEYKEESGTAFILSFPVLDVLVPEIKPSENSVKEKAGNA
jgi:PAS domain S-box-containing protein